MTSAYSAGPKQQSRDVSNGLSEDLKASMGVIPRSSVNPGCQRCPHRPGTH